MSKILRQPTREDWNNVDRLQFRSSNHKIIGVFVEPEFNEGRESMVTVIRIASNDAFVTSKHLINGTFVGGSENSNFDIFVAEEKEPIPYAEIVKELAVKRAWIAEGNNLFEKIASIDFDKQLFFTTDWKGKEYYRLEGTKITFDFKDFYTFEQYLEMRHNE